MATQDETIKRVADAMQPWYMGSPEADDDAKVALTALRPGDRLPGGLVVTLEEPTEAMYGACQRAEYGCDSPFRGIPRLWIAGYKAMLAAQESNS